MSQFHALLVEKTANGFTRTVVERSIADLPAGEVLIDVRYSSLNYKDGLSATGNPGVTRNFPHTPGIDAAGIVTESTSAKFAPGDEVIVIGYDLGMNTPGGFGQRIRVPGSWVVRKPSGLTLHESMALGTAGFTAALAVHKLEHAGMNPAGGPVLVTGATGGVGSVAVMLLCKLGYQVAAVTGKADQHEFLRSLGATQILSREEARADAQRPLHKETWGGVVDCVGGEMLVNALKSLRYGCGLAACGLVESPAISATVLPFILRGVNLLGVDSVQLPLQPRTEIWNKLAGPWKLEGLSRLEERLTLSTLSEAIDRILDGRMVGRGVVDLNV
jgi:acrylyl-CoA reductase (NADPH)